MQFKQKYGPWAVIAGSAEGLGESWSRALARRGVNLIMVDNQADKLQDLSSTLQNEYQVQTITLSIDLNDAGASEKIMKETAAVDCRLLIYNAAYSIIRPFIEVTPDELDNFTQINVRTQIRLVHAFTSHLVEKGKGGGIIMMSSLAGLLGMQLVAPYAATKAFSWNLAEAISHELKPHNIDVMACIAGATSTPAYMKTKPRYGWPKPQVMEPEKVAEEALKHFGRRNLHITGFSNRMNYFLLTRILPRKMASRIANNTIKKMYSK